MRQFKNKKVGYKTLRNKILILMIPLTLITCVFVYIISFADSTGNKTSNFNQLPYTMAIIIGIMAYSLYRSNKRQKAIYNSYTLTINDESITREQYNTATIRFLNEDIRKITKTGKGAFLIQGDKPTEYILISADVEDKPELEILLKKICEFSFSTQKPIIAYLILPLIIVFISINGSRICIGQ